MLVVRALRWAAWSVLAFAAPAAAADRPALEVRATPDSIECPDDGAVRRRVDAILGRPAVRGPGEGALRVFVVDVARIGGGLLADIRLEAGGTVRGRRRLETTAPDCDSLMSAVALHVAVAIDPVVAMATPPSSTRVPVVSVPVPPRPPSEVGPVPDVPVDPAIEPGERSLRSDSGGDQLRAAVSDDPDRRPKARRKRRPRPRGLAVVPADVPPMDEPVASPMVEDRVEPEPEPAPEPEPPTAVRLWAGGLGYAGATPAMAFGGLLGFEWQRGEWFIGLDGRAIAPAGAPRAGGEVRAWQTAGAISGCYRVGGAGLCAVAALGVQGGDGMDFDETSSVDGPYIAAGGRFVFDRLLGGGWFARAAGELLAPATELALAVDGEVAWASSAVVGGAWLGVGRTIF